MLDCGCVGVFENFILFVFVIFDSIVGVVLIKVFVFG